MKEFKTKPKSFFSYARSKQGVKTDVSRLEDEDDNVINTENEAVDVLNRFFESVLM